MATRNGSKWHVIGPIIIIVLAIGWGILPVCMGVKFLPASFGVGSSPVCGVLNAETWIGLISQAVDHVGFL